MLHNFWNIPFRGGLEIVAVSILLLFAFFTTILTTSIVSFLRKMKKRKMKRKKKGRRFLDLRRRTHSEFCLYSPSRLFSWTFHQKTRNTCDTFNVSFLCNIPDWVIYWILELLVVIITGWRNCTRSMEMSSPSCSETNTLSACALLNTTRLWSTPLTDLVSTFSCISSQREK